MNVSARSLALVPLFTAGLFLGACHSAPPPPSVIAPAPVTPMPPPPAPPPKAAHQQAPSGEDPGQEQQGARRGHPDSSSDKQDPSGTTSNHDQQDTSDGSGTPPNYTDSNGHQRNTDPWIDDQLNGTDSYSSGGPGSESTRQNQEQQRTGSTGQSSPECDAVCAKGN